MNGAEREWEHPDVSQYRVDFQNNLALVAEAEAAGVFGAEPEATAWLPLHQAIREIVLDTKTAAFDKRRQIRDLIRAELLRGGFLCQTADGRGFYFGKSERRLYDLEQRPFQHLVAALSGLSATESHFRFVLDALQTEAARTTAVDVHTLSFFDASTGVLSVSDCGGGVWRRERNGAWKYGYNGDGGLLFLTESDAKPWVPEFGSSGGLAWFLSRLSVDGAVGLSCEDQQTLLLVFMLQNFFPALRRTRIIPAALGPQGSCKSTMLRMLGKLYVGPDFDVTGLSANREDAFVAAVCSRVIVALDNADSRIPWLEDALATYATGLRYRLRRLYTTNEEVSYVPRAMLLISSRDPHFRRPDVAERLLTLAFQRPQAYVPESVLFDELLSRRGAIMGELLGRAAAVADSLATLKLPALRFRMADYASFGWVVSAAAGHQADWEGLLTRLESSQMQFAGESDSLILVLRTLLEREGTIGPIDVGALYRQCSDLAREQSLPLARTPQGFGKHLTNMRRVIEIELGAVITEERAGGGHRVLAIKRRR